MSHKANKKEGPSDDPKPNTVDRRLFLKGTGILGVLQYSNPPKQN